MGLENREQLARLGRQRGVHVAEDLPHLHREALQLSHGEDQPFDGLDVDALSPAKAANQEASTRAHGG